MASKWCPQALGFRFVPLNMRLVWGAGAFSPVNHRLEGRSEDVALMDESVGTDTQPMLSRP